MSKFRSSNIQPSQLGFSRGNGRYLSQAVIRKYYLAQEIDNALGEELTKRINGRGGTVFSYRVNGDTLYVMAEDEAGLETIEAILVKLVREVREAQRLNKLRGMLK